MFFNGVFIFMCISLVVFPGLVMPVAFFLPSMYYIWSGRLVNKRFFLLSLAPLLLAFIPACLQGAIIYGCMLGFSVIQKIYIDKGHPGLSVLLPSAFLVMIFMIYLGIRAYMLSKGPLFVMNQWVHQVMDQVAGVYEHMLTKDQLMEFRINRPTMEHRIVMLMPVLVTLMISLVAWFNLIIVSNVKQGLGLRDWRSPEWLVYAFIAAGVMTLVPSRPVSIVGVNAIGLLLIVYFFQGMAIIAFYLYLNRWRLFIKVIIYVLIFTQVYIMFIVAGLGLFDTWFDFRTRISNRRKGDTA